VLLIVRNKVVEREPVMAGDEVDALIRRTGEMLVEVSTSGHSRRDRTGESFVASDESSDVIAIAPVPFGPSFPREASDLIQPGCIPGLGKDLGFVKNWIGFDFPKKRRILHRSA
jgi:hypothetical protein